MNKYDFDENGLPLVPYLPDVADQVPLPKHPHERYSDITAHAGEVLGPVHCNNPTTQVDSICACTIEELKALKQEDIELMEKWEEDARKAGHKHAFIVHDGSWFWPVYRRPGTMEDIAKLKEEARETLTELEQILADIKETKEFLKKMGDLGEDKDE